MGDPVSDLFQFDQIHIDDFEGLIISSVVPPVLDMLQAMAEKYFHVRAAHRGTGYRYGNRGCLREPR